MTGFDRCSSVDDPGSVTIGIRTDVCALYLDVPEDLWNVDSGLNHGISQIGIDLSELSHLTELEKETVGRIILNYIHNNSAALSICFLYCCFTSQLAT